MNIDELVKVIGDALSKDNHLSVDSVSDTLFIDCRMEDGLKTIAEAISKVIEQRVADLEQRIRDLESAEREAETADKIALITLREDAKRQASAAAIKWAEAQQTIERYEQGAKLFFEYVNSAPAIIDGSAFYKKQVAEQHDRKQRLIQLFTALTHKIKGECPKGGDHDWYASVDTPKRKNHKCLKCGEPNPHGDEQP